MKVKSISELIPDIICALIFFYIIGYFFSTAISSVASVLLATFWLISKQYIYMPSIIKSQPIVIVGCALFLCFLIAIYYSPVSHELAVSDMNKYRKFLYIPILMTFFIEERYRKWAWIGFFAASFLTLFFSYLKIGGILDLNDSFKSPTIKNRITHSMYIAFFAYYCLSKANQEGKYKYLFQILFILCLHNLFFIVDGRTGQILVVGLIVLYAYQFFSKKTFFITLVVLMFIVGGFLKYSTKAERINTGIEDTISLLNDGYLDQRYSDLEVRYALWKYSAQLMGEKPVFGHGTGSFKQQLNRIAKNHVELLAYDHPHNEFFKIGVELGMVGLMLYLGFYLCMFMQLPKLSQENKYLAQGLLLSLLIVSLYNCPIYDHAQGNWFITLIALCYLPKNLILKPDPSHA